MLNKNIFIKNIIVVGLLYNTTFADISKDNLDKYLNVSSAGAFFYTYHFNTLIKLAKQGLDKEYLKNMVNNKKYLNLYAHDFMKLHKNDYIQLMNFYESKIGKKYTESIYNISKIHKSDYQKLYVQNKCIEEKQELIEKINKNLNILNLKLSFAKRYLLEINALQPKNLQKSINEMEIAEINYKEKLIQNEKILSCLQYKNFTVEELHKINDYASKKILQNEIQLIYESMNKYIKVFFEDIKEPLAKSYKEIQKLRGAVIRKPKNPISLSQDKLQ